MSVIQPRLGTTAARAPWRGGSTLSLVVMLGLALACSDPAEPLPECLGDVELYLAEDLRTLGPVALA